MFQRGGGAPMPMMMEDAMFDDAMMVPEMAMMEPQMDGGNDVAAR
jgi:hypothetical protein